jgi:hypothetical protein
MNLKNWIIFCSTLSLFGFFLDWLFNADVRVMERKFIRSFFQKLYKNVGATNFNQIQILSCKYILNIITQVFGSNTYETKFIKKIIFISVLSTLAFSFAGNIFSNIKFYNNITNDTGILLIYFKDDINSFQCFLLILLTLVGSSFFNFLSVLIFIKCIRYILIKNKYFFVISIVNFIFNYFMIFCFLLLGSLFGKLNLIPNDLYINNYLFKLNYPMFLLNDYIGTIMLFTSATSIVPMLLFSLFTISLSLIKIFQWVFATTCARFGEENKDKTFFGWIATSITLIASLLKMIKDCIEK